MDSHNLESLVDYSSLTPCQIWIAGLCLETPQYRSHTFSKWAESLDCVFQAASSMCDWNGAILHSGLGTQGSQNSMEHVCPGVIAPGIPSAKGL